MGKLDQPPAVGRTVRLGIRTNLAQFSLLVGVNALVGGMVGQERTILPLLATRTFHGNAATYGNLLALFGVGSLIGSLAMASRASTPNARRLARFGCVLGVLSVAVAVAPWLSVEWVLMVPLGAISIAFAIVGNSTLQLTSTDAMRGRVMALCGVIFLGSNPIGGPVMGWLAQHTSPRLALGAGAVVALAASIGGVLSWRPASSARPG